MNKHKKQGFTYFSIFSGIGGFELGIQKAMGYAKCVGFSEIDKYAVSIYKKHFKNHKNYGDATKIIPTELPDFDCLVGGFPCQAFSVAGKRAGFGDTRGTMFFEIARIVRQKQPRLLVLENVKGLLSHEQGNSAHIIASTLDELGYDIEWQVCNSKNHGVPQNRERIFIIGHLRASGKSAKEIFSIQQGDSETAGVSQQENNSATLTTKPADGARPGTYVIETKQSQKIKEGIKIVQLNKTNLKSNHGAQPYYQDRVYDPNGLSPALSGFREPKVICFNAERGLRDKDPNPNRGGGSGMLSRDDGLSYAITANSANHPVQIIGGSQANRVYDSKGIAITQKALGGGLGAKTGLYAVDGEIHTLMPIECERLQGFSDNWTQYGVDGEKISDTQRYKCCGNAVNTKVVKAIFDKLKPTFVDQQTEQKLLIPRVVSFSGGRTSAMMLLQLLEQGKLQPWRGDCVVFNNTAAEHSATYSFVARIKKIVEQQYNLPFFILEFCTYEAKTSRGYARRMTYKLVNALPYCQTNNPNGYKFRGEVFEEVISHTGTLPNNFQRNCTVTMKILTTNHFLTDWFSSANTDKAYIEQQGVYSKTSNISDLDIVKKHKMHRGELSNAVIIAKKTFVRSCPTFRAKQFFQDYTSADVNYHNCYLAKKMNNNQTKSLNKAKTNNNQTNSLNKRISLFGNNAVKYHNYIGIRFDEKHRAERIRNRIKQAKLNLNRSSKNKKGGSIKTQPPFEVVKMPMIRAKINKAKVIAFWQEHKRSKYDLDLPFDGMLSNCVHCPLKGKSKNQLIANRTAQIEAKTNTNTNTNLDCVDVLTPNISNSLDISSSPSTLSWWIAIERKYARKVIKSKNNHYTNIGFFGASKHYVYQTWADELHQNNTQAFKEVLTQSSERDSWGMDCHCTD